MITISQLQGREVLDSRANPTVEVDVVLSDGSMGRAAVPSGASTGAAEVVELRDGETARFSGLGVLRAIDNVHNEIAPQVIGRSPFDQADLDAFLVGLDGTPDKSRLGGNAILAVSVAVAQAAARSEGLPLYRYLADGCSISLPVPMFNILNGGRHAEDSMDIQEFMVVPAGLDSFAEALRAGAEVYRSLQGILRQRGLGTTVGDEGGFAPRCVSNLEALDLVLQAIENAGYDPGRQCFIALDVAASELVLSDGRYSLPGDNEVLSSRDLIDTYQKWLRNYPIVSIEDGMAQDDWDGWTELTARIGASVQVVGDDIYTTNPTRIRKGIESGASNAVLVKLNQIGTVTESLEAIRTAKEVGWAIVVSHRSGETEDTTIADLAVGTAAGQIKAGAPCRGERTAKYNRLMRIEEEIGDAAEYARPSVYARRVMSGQVCSTSAENGMPLNLEQTGDGVPTPDGY